MVAVTVLAEQVPRPEPFAAHDLVRGLGALVITLHDAGTAHPKLAGLAGGDFAPFAIDNPAFAKGNGKAACPRANHMGRFNRHRERRAGLGRAVYLADWSAEAVLETSMKVLVQVG